MMKTIDQVKEFNAAYNLPLPETAVLEGGGIELQFDLLDEELKELETAYVDGDATEIFDGLLDVQYILDGLFIRFGMASIKTEGFAEVHRSNMSKLGIGGEPMLRPDGKILKGPNYSKPNLAPILAKVLTKP